MDAIRCFANLLKVTRLQVPKVVSLLLVEKESRSLIHLLKEVDFIVNIHLDHAYPLVTNLFLKHTL